MRIAAIDVGSNSIHMVIAQVEADGRFRVLDRAKEMVRLGHQTLSRGRLSARAMNTGVATLAAFRTLAERQGVNRTKAVATSAVREAANGGDFIARVENEVGLRLRVIPGREEARLIYLGVRHAIDLRDGTSVIVDIGGGSVELVLVEDGKPAALESFKLGVARLTEQYLKGDPPSAASLARLNAHFDEELHPVLQRFARHPVRRVVGTSGTMLNLISIAGHLRGEPPDGHLNGFPVSSGELRRVRRLLAKANRAGRLRIKGLDAKRVDFITAGACLADAIIRPLPAEEVVGCTWALREGVLLDFIARHRPGIEETERFAEPRRRSVARFARHLGESGSHPTQVARLALRLFDQLNDQLQLSAAAREWLEFAALLHDVGHHISHENHHRHAYYLITNGDLLGFRRDELEIIGLAARYHRKAAPKETDPEYAALSRPLRRVVRAVSGLLRVADALDRSHYGVVRDVVVNRHEKRVVLQVQTGGDDAALEIWEARQRAKVLEEVLGLDVDFRVVS